MFKNLINRPIEFDEPCRGTAANAVRRHRLGDDSTCCHCSSSPNVDTSKQGNIAANPNILFDNNILIEALWLIRFSDITNKCSDNASVISRMHRKVLCDGAVSLTNEFGIECRDFRVGTYADTFAKVNILIVTRI